MGGLTTTRSYFISLNIDIDGHLILPKSVGGLSCFRDPTGPIVLHILTQEDPLIGGKTLAPFPVIGFVINAPTCKSAIVHTITGEW